MQVKVIKLILFFGETLLISRFTGLFHTRLIVNIDSADQADDRLSDREVISQIDPELQAIRLVT